MISKKLSGTLLGFTTLALASCSQQELSGSVDGAPDGVLITTTVGMSAENAIASRATPDVFGGTDNFYSWSGNSGLPSVDNIDLGKHPLTYTIGIYTKKVDGNYALVEELQSKQSQSTDEVYFNFRLIKGQTYRLVAYADYSSAAKTDLTNIDLTAGRSATETPKDAYILNDELNDAFFVSENFVASEHVSAILKRPFGKLRLIARDFNVFSAGEVLQIEGIEVSFKGNEMLPTDKFNALTGKFVKRKDVEAAESYKFTSIPVVYKNEFEANGKAEYAAVFTIYLPANPGKADESGEYKPVEEGTVVPQSWMYPFDIKVTYTDKRDTKGNLKTLTRSFGIDIPVKRNWLTTVDAEYFWTDNSNIKVSIDKRFDGSIEIEPKTIYVNNQDELYKAITEIKASESKTGQIALGADFNITKPFDAENYPNHGILIKANAEEELHITLDLNGHTIENKSDSRYLISVYGYGNKSTSLVIEDTNKEKTGTLFGGKCEGDNFYIDKSVVAVFWGGELTINSGNFIVDGDNHAVYEYDNEYSGNHLSKVVINGGYYENLQGDKPGSNNNLEHVYMYLIRIIG